jgi:hypothetical protein
MQPIEQHIVWTVKGLTRDLVDRAGKIERAAAKVGLSPSHLQRCGDPDVESTLNLPAVILLERDTGRPLVTEYLALLAGFRLVPLDAKPGATGVAEAFTGAVGEVSELLATTAGAISDDVVTEREKRSIAEAGTDARDAIDGLTRAVASSPVRLVPRRG